ncbi:MAG: single-stranded-DNA-specific exonuclease RecJ [Acidobacteria bacterium]|nr:single-stranded-DNA-specific exonuclease RecJ [Acidobacteriota bacterium]
MPGARWLFPARERDPIRGFAETLSIGLPAAAALLARGICDPASARRFLNPALGDLHHPCQLAGIESAVDCIRRAIHSQRKILICGDYDVDGALSVILLLKAVELAGGAADYHVPHRLKDGYGLKLETLDAAAAAGASLIISADTGIRDLEVVREAAARGLEVIITDHHLPDTALPAAAAVVNPNRRDCAYPEKNLCGAGVAFKLAHALLATLGWPEARLRRTLESFLKLVAIATVADVVPLSGENRVIVWHGLRGLRSVRNPGLRALLLLAGVAEGSTPSAHQVAFRLAPRMNAAGRMDTARDLVELLRTADAGRAGELAERLDALNAARQQAESGILDQILEQCSHQPVTGSQTALVFSGAGWHRGVLGIVASRLVERFHRPVFVLSEEDALAQGSGRSVPGFHLLEALETMPELFLKFGGHRQAAGLTLESRQIEIFRERLNAQAARQLGPEDFCGQIGIDAVLELQDFDEPAIDEVLALAPFGCGNPAPRFAALALELAAPPAIWREKHLRLLLRQNGRSIWFQAWNFAARAGELAPGSRVDAVFRIQDDSYGAVSRWSAVLEDFRPASRDLEAAAVA